MPSEEPTPAPTDPAAFDEWAREAADSWNRSRVHEVAAARWADGSLPLEQRAVAAVWNAPTGTPSVDELAELVADPELDPVLRARVQAALAAATVAGEPARACRLAEEALASVSGAGVDIRTQLNVSLTASEVLVRSNRPADAMKVLEAAGEAAKADGAAPRWAFLAIDAERLSIVAPQARNRQQLAASVDKVAQAALALPPGPTVLDVLVKMGGLLSALGAAPRVEQHMEAALRVTEGVPEAQGIRFQALLVLADARFAKDGPDAAMDTQREAIAAIEPMGDTPMLGWAHRGLAVQLRSVDRHRESAEEFGTAAAVYEGAGMAYDAAALRLEQASSLLTDDDPAGARSLVDEVLQGLGSVPEQRHAAIEMRANQVLAQVSTYEGELEPAAEHWLEVADLARQVGISPLEAIVSAAQLYAADGDIDEARAQFGRAELAAADEPDPAAATASVMRLQAEALREAGHAEDAAELARVAANHARASGDEAQAVYLSVIAADSLHASGDGAAAIQVYEETIEAARAASMPALEAAVHTGYAKVLRAMGRDDEAQVHEGTAAELGRDPGGSAAPG